MNKLIYIKYVRLSFIFILLLFINGCGPSISFEEPQPAGTDPLSEFPKRLRGEYQNTAGNSILQIEEKTIRKINDYDLKIAINQPDSTYQLKNDTLINLENNERIKIIVEGDSIIEHIHNEEIFFSISGTNVLKKFKGYYFLNFGSGTSWSVQKLEMDKGHLSLSEMSAKQDLELLKAITETQADTTSYKFKPTKRQFRKFIRKDGFSDSEIFTKIRSTK